MLHLFKSFTLIGCLLYLSSSCQSQKKESIKIQNVDSEKNMSIALTDTATFGGGCFWCVEAIYQDLNGVVSVTSGYSGGTKVDPSYEQICNGNTGHAEVVQIIYDPKIITFDELLEVFWTVHDPTTLDRQGADVGTQYRSVIFYHNVTQKETAEKYKQKLNDEKTFDSPVVTEISPFEIFYAAEKYHQNYYKDNENQPYCSLVIRPKIEKFQKVFKNKMKH